PSVLGRRARDREPAAAAVPPPRTAARPRPLVAHLEPDAVRPWLCAQLDHARPVLDGVREQVRDRLAEAGAVRAYQRRLAPRLERHPATRPARDGVPAIRRGS